jgi:hypothetical protein
MFILHYYFSFFLYTNFLKKGIYNYNLLKLIYIENYRIFKIFISFFLYVNKCTNAHFSKMNMKYFDLKKKGILKSLNE